MKQAVTLYDRDGVRWVVITRDPLRPDHLIDTNEYLVAVGDRGVLLDPGGMAVFPAVFSALAQVFDPRGLEALFASHQDPDIISSLALWLDFKPELRCYVSRLWHGFVPHFGGDAATLIPLPDEGREILVGGHRLQAVPAHYLHSSGNFHLYDPTARILFSGDVGAALLSPEAGLFVTDFDAHIRHAEAFHRRWMGSREAKRRWCERVAALAVDQLCPQHGAIYRGGDVERFIHWFDELEVGCAL